MSPLRYSFVKTGKSVRLIDEGNEMNVNNIEVTPLQGTETLPLFVLLTTHVAYGIRGRQEEHETI